MSKALPNVTTTRGFQLIERGARIGAGLGVVGSTLAGYLDARRFSFAYLVAFTFVTGTMIAALFFVALQHVTRSGWSATVRRAAENIASPIRLIGPMFLIVGIFGLGLHYLYAWSVPGALADPALASKATYFNGWFYVARTVLYIGSWNVLFTIMVGRSVRQDTTKDPALTAKNARFAAPAIVLYALTSTFAAFDWVMSIDVRWYSTMFGVYMFAGHLVAALALITLVALGLRRAGLGALIPVDVIHDLGKLLFAFTVFWGYIAFSQYMLIWYANIPEETAFYRARWGGAWLTLSFVLAAAHFALPFAVLLSRTAKRASVVLGGACVWLLAAHYLDLFWLIAPSASPSGPVFGWVELATFLMLASFCTMWALRRFKLHAPIAIGDPYLPEVIALASAHAEATEPPPRGEPA